MVDRLCLLCCLWGSMNVLLYPLSKRSASSIGAHSCSATVIITGIHCGISYYTALPNMQGRYDGRLTYTTKLSRAIMLLSTAIVMDYKHVMVNP